ncbi:MAG TPA: hypothetical protein VEQ58_02405, partial [Polyangiaceae bacterium]|nr:hypothetical protein [Polyangiaceae bacterium]
YTNPLQPVAHNTGFMTIFHNAGQFLYQKVGSMQAPWKVDTSTNVGASTDRIQTASNVKGDVFATWLDSSQILASSFDVSTTTWSPALTLPTENAAGEPNVALGPDGSAMAIWITDDGTTRALLSSRYTLSGGWKPVVSVTDIYPDPLFDAPGLVFDGETFVAAWTGESGEHYAAYTARYDAAHNKWHAPEAPHLAAQGNSALFMPRLGADAHGNLLLVWGIEGKPTRLVYQHYRAESREWTSAQFVSGVSFTDSSFGTETGKLPFAVAANGLGGLMFRNVASSTSTTLKLAQFY